MHRSGLEAFLKLYPKAEVLVVGGDGVAVVDFLSQDKWLGI